LAGRFCQRIIVTFVDSFSGAQIWARAPRFEHLLLAYGLGYYPVHNHPIVHVIVSAERLNMKQSVLIQTVACCSGLAGLYFANSPEFRWVLAALILISALAAIAVAWSERESKNFVERALESLILSSKPNDMARKRVTSAINKQGAQRNSPSTQTISFSDGTTQVRFFDENHAELGVLLVDEEDISRLAVMPDRELFKATERLFTDRKGDEARNRDEIVEAVSNAARVTLWENDIKTPEWCMWVNDDLIAAPIDPPNQTCDEKSRLTFKSNEFENLAKVSDFALCTLVQDRTKKLLLDQAVS
jgi:hypothetical protein